MTPPPLDPLPPEQLAEIEDVIDEATATDGVRPLDEHATLELRAGVPGWNLGARDDEQRLIGYARLSTEGDAHLVVRPEFRRIGVGTALLSQLVQLSDGSPLRVWAHGPTPGARPLADKLGLRAARELWRMRRSLLEPLPDHPLPDGVTVRAFRAGDPQDEQAIVSVNAAAFADHPEQGRMTLEELRLRMTQDWFDPAGLLLAVHQERVIGFHWTKVHEPPVRGESPTDRVGEIYVLGIDPAYGMPGLGKALAVVGLEHLAGLGLPVAMLFTESDNAKAVHLYEKLAFTHADTDVMYVFT